MSARKRKAPAYDLRTLEMFERMLKRAMPPEKHSGATPSVCMDCARQQLLIRLGNAIKRHAARARKP